MKIACRWPGGHNLVLTRPNGQHIVIHLNGPPGGPTMMPFDMRDRPSREAAHLLHKRVLDTVKRLKLSAGNAFAPDEYATTDVSGQFWNEWYAKNKDFDIVKDRMVFSLEH